MDGSLGEVAPPAEERRRYSPQLKKAISYKRDHAYAVENKDSFGKQWPRKKAHANRAYRRGVRVAVTEIAPRPTDEERDGRDPAAMRRRIVRKWLGTAQPLGQWVRRRSAV